MLEKQVDPTDDQAIKNWHKSVAMLVGQIDNLQRKVKPSQRTEWNRKRKREIKESTEHVESQDNLDVEPEEQTGKDDEKEEDCEFDEDHSQGDEKPDTERNIHGDNKLDPVQKPRDPGCNIISDYLGYYWSPMQKPGDFIGEFPEVLYLSPPQKPTDRIEFPDELCLSPPVPNTHKFIHETPNSGERIPFQSPFGFLFHDGLSPGQPLLSPGLQGVFDRATPAHLRPSPEKRDIKPRSLSQQLAFLSKLRTSYP